LINDWLKDIPEELWAKSKTDIARMKGAAQVVLIPKSIHRTYKAQYPFFTKPKRSSNQIVFVTCAEYNSEMITYKHLTNNSVSRKYPQKCTYKSNK
jgi:hypothetical protein